jgi:hypothetical protein
MAGHYHMGQSWCSESLDACVPKVGTEPWGNMLIPVSPTKVVDYQAAVSFPLNTTM